LRRTRRSQSTRQAPRQWTQTARVPTPSPCDPGSPLTRATTTQSDPIPCHMHPPACGCAGTADSALVRRLVARSLNRCAGSADAATGEMVRPPVRSKQTNNRTNKRTNNSKRWSRRGRALVLVVMPRTCIQIFLRPGDTEFALPERVCAPLFRLRLCMQVSAELLKQLEEMGFPTVGSARRPVACCCLLCDRRRCPPSLAPPPVRARGRAHACAHDPQKARPRMRARGLRRTQSLSCSGSAHCWRLALTDRCDCCAAGRLPQVRAERALWNSGNQILDQARTSGPVACTPPAARRTAASRARRAT
jgi:hypothetical protein